MSTWKTWILMGAVLTWGMAWAAPGLINYQGRLTNSSGHPVTVATDVTFTFWNAETGGTQLGSGFSDTDTVTPDADGIYSTLIGDDPGNLVPPSVFSSDSVWLNVNVGGEDLVPRVRITSVGFALQAAAAGHASTADTANEATHATSADTAASATNASTAGHASTADTAASANEAAHATSADTATNATHATSADTAASATNASTAGHASTADTAASADEATHAASADTATNADNAALLGGIGATGFLHMTADAYVVVRTTSNAATNGLNLRAAYAAAKALAPNGAALAATNRAVLLVPPGNYDLRTASLTLDTDYVDVIGLSTDREDQTIYSGGNVLVQTASDVHIENLVLQYTGASDTIFAYEPNATWIDRTSQPHTGSPRLTIIRNCEFKASTYSMALNLEYAGTYEDCVAGGLYAFGGGSSGVASGTFTNCTGGDYAFGVQDSSSSPGGVASGTFTNCTGGDSAFGGEVGKAGGTFTNCTGGNFAFGGYYGVASGVFNNCAGGDYAFGGYNGTASGTFTNCSGGTQAFDMASGTFTGCTGGAYAFGLVASGTFVNCTGGDYAFGGGNGSASGGKFYHCVGGAGAFTGAGSPAPVQLFCIQNGAQYAGNN